MMTPERDAEAVYDRLANEACEHCLFGGGYACTCPSAEDQRGWLRDLARRCAAVGFAGAFEALAGEVYRLAVTKGWWDEPRSDGDCVALMHSELSEALEALRLPERRRSEKIPEFLQVEEELADAIIRIADFANARGYRVGAAVLAKHGYNATRPHRHGGKRF